MPISVTAEIDTPLYQRVGENLNKVNLETTGTQVKLTKQNGITQDDVQKELEALHAAVDTGLGEGAEDCVKGPASAVDGNLAAFDQTTGKLIKDSGVTMTDAADAVARKHEHANQTDVLDKLGVDEGKLTYDGQPVGGDSLRDVVFADNLDAMPADLRDGGLLLVATPTA